MSKEWCAKCRRMFDTNETPGVWYSDERKATKQAQIVLCSVRCLNEFLEKTGRQPYKRQANGGT